MAVDAALVPFHSINGFHWKQEGTTMSNRPFNPAGNHTIDGVLITLGLRVYDYDLRPGTVVADEHDGDVAGDDWYRVVRDPNEDGTGGGYRLFNGSRMWTTHPSDGTVPPAGPDMPEYGIVTPAPLSCCGWQWDEEILNQARQGQVSLDETPTHRCTARWEVIDGVLYKIT